jgi:hypothetical protein
MPLQRARLREGAGEGQLEAKPLSQDFEEPLVWNLSGIQREPFALALNEELPRDTLPQSAPDHAAATQDSPWPLGIGPPPPRLAHNHAWPVRVRACSLAAMSALSTTPMS